MMNADEIKKMLFLDVDGVLNRCGESGQGLESHKVALLERIVKESDPLIVVSSTWRFIPHQFERLKTMLRDIGGRLGGATPDPLLRDGEEVYLAKGRGHEIQEWMDANGTPECFVILDDDRDMYHLSPHLVRTDSFTGLTEALADEVIRRLNHF